MDEKLFKNRYIPLNYHFETINSQPEILEENATNLQFRRRYNDIGSFEIKVYGYNHKYSSQDRNNNIYYILDSLSKELYVVSGIEYVEEESGDYHILSGYDAKSINKKTMSRHRNPSSTTASVICQKLWDSAISTSSYKTPVDYPESTKRFTQGASFTSDVKTYNNYDPISSSADWKKMVLYDLMAEILKDNDAGQKIIFEKQVGDVTNRLSHYNYRGRDRSGAVSTIKPFIFSKEKGNLARSSYLIDRSDVMTWIFWTCAFNDIYPSVYQGKINLSHDSDLPTTGFYYEERISGEDLNVQEEINGVKYRAKLEALNHIKTNTYDFEISDTTGYNPTFSWSESTYDNAEQYNLGDVIAYKNSKLNLTIATRIVGVDEVIKNGELSLKLYFGKMKKRKF